LQVEDQVHKAPPALRDQQVHRDFEVVMGKLDPKGILESLGHLVRWDHAVLPATLAPWALKARRAIVVIRVKLEGQDPKVILDYPVRKAMRAHRGQQGRREMRVLRDFQANGDLQDRKGNQEQQVHKV
jgi:hypothetical protein